MRKNEFYAVKFLIYLFVITAGLCGCSSGQPRRTVLTIGTADSGGTMYPVGDAIAQVISNHTDQIEVNISASNGSYNNVLGIQNGQIDLGLVSGDVAYAAYHNKNNDYKQPVTELRAIGAVYSSLSNWMAPDSGDITYVHDLKGKRIAVGPQGSTTELSARIALETVGLNPSNTTFENYGLGSGGIEVEQGSIDALHGFAGTPINGLTQLAETVPCHLLKYTDGELKQIVSEESSYFKTVIPAGTYPGQKEAVNTFGVKCLICVNKNMSEDLVYTITKILGESVDQLADSHESMAAMKEKGFMCRDLPVPLHPGAEKYYREKGLLD